MLLCGLPLSACDDAPGTAPAAGLLDEQACLRWEETAAREPDPVATLRRQALEAWERSAAGASAEEWERLQIEIRVCAQAPACAPDAASLPWEEWIQADRARRPELARHTLRGAHAALGARILPLARSLDLRETSDVLRLEAHRILWSEDPGEAGARARAVLFRETPRAQDRLRPAYVEEVLPLAPAPDAHEILIAVLADDGMEHRARLGAIRWLREHRAGDAAPVLESVFIGERINFIIRREALLALIELDAERGCALIARRLPEEQADPGLREFLDALRAAHGVTAR
jgi:hypothetical protein